MKETDEKKIRDEIDSQIKRNKTVYNREMLHTKKGKKGIGFPLFVFVLSATLFSSTVGFVYFLNIKTAESTMSQTKQISEVGAVNQLIKNLREQAEENIKKKQAEIDLQNLKIGDLEGDIKDSKFQIQVKIEARQNEYEVEIAEKIDIEKIRLEALKLAENEIQEKLGLYEAELKGTYNTKLLAYRKELELDIENKEKHLATLEKDYRIKQEDTNKEIERIKIEAAKQQRDYDKQLITLNSQMMQDMQSASTDLASLQERKDREERLLRQLNGFYLTVNNQIEAKQYTRARETLTSMQNFMKTPTYLSSPALVASAESDLLIISLLSELIYGKETEEKRESVAALHSVRKDPEYITMETNFNTSIAKAIDSIDKNNIDQAVKDFSEAIGNLPFGVSSTSVIESILHSKERSFKENLTIQLSKEFETSNTLAKENLRNEYVDQIDQLNSQTLVLQTSVQELEAQLGSKVDLTNGELKELLSQIQLLEEKSQTAQNELTKSRKVVEELSKELRSSNQKISDLNIQIKDEMDKDSNLPTPAAILKLENELSSEKENYVVLQNEMAQLESSNLTLKEQYDALFIENQAIIAQPQQDSDALVVAEIEELQIKLDDSIALVASLQVELKDSTDQIASLSDELAQQVDGNEEESVTLLTTKLQESESEYELLLAKNTELNSTNLELLQEVEVLTNGLATTSESQEKFATQADEIVLLSSQLTETEATIKNLMAELDLSKSNYGKLETEGMSNAEKVADAEKANAEFALVQEEYEALLRSYQALDKSSPYALLTMENRFAEFFSSPKVQGVMPNFNVIFQDYTRTLQNRANGEDQLFASITNNVKDIASYPTRVTMLENIDELIDFESDNVFKITLLSELKKLVSNVE